VDEKMKIGLAVQNLGTKIEFVSESDPLPLNIKLGVGYKLLDNNLTLGLDINYPNDNNINFALGAEYIVKKIRGIILPLRVGYNTKATADLGSPGVGVGLGIIVNKFDFDFAWVPYGDLGQTYRLALKIKF